MKKVKIFVEGVADCKFIQDYIQYLFNVKLDKNDIIEIGGCDKKSLSLRIGTFQRNADEGGINLLIFDADDSFDEKQEELKRTKKELNIEFEIFLFPNHELPGDLEVLLSNIVSDKHNALVACWEQYENCLKTQEYSYTLPARKTKIYAYLEALVGKSNSQKEKIKERNRNYRNTDHWNLDTDYLQPLKTFLNQYFT